MACFQNIASPGEAKNPGPTARSRRRSKVHDLLDFHLP